MNSINRILIAVSVVVIVLVFVPAASAQGSDEANWSTRITFDTSVQIGSLVLAPGTYHLQLTPGSWARNVVAIYSADSGRWMGMAMGINDSRMDTSRRSGFTFIERPNGEPRMLEYWFYPEWNRGVKFIYPRTQTADTVAMAVAPVAK